MESFKVKVNGKEIEMPLDELFDACASDRLKAVLKSFSEQPEHAKPARDVK